MRVVFIQPSVGRKADGTSYPAAWRMEPLGIARLAALTPPDVGRVFFDDRLEPVDTETPADLACLAVETFTARRAYQIADAFRRWKHARRIARAEAKIAARNFPRAA